MKGGVLKLFWNKIKTEYIYEVLNFKKKYEKIQIDSVKDIENIIFWHFKTIDIKIQDLEYWIIVQNKEESKKLIDLILKNISIEKIKDRSWKWIINK